ncbi:hypothetical protein AcW1_005888 [Taiwanofungus camphoratus]|nr:hypothetical protein AcW2_004643 [Antrodia cinnamomea]KAI0934328.1 hypothetical protein AcV5_006204 [Antrodia cinnamomea]KAI0950385.1 hypothetical protein AcV7_008867 [Antrodia cinnamomea]KAI0957520.1 hypothetical protein AcW1_005888 [Antrodia cinnamomea]
MLSKTPRQFIRFSTRPVLQTRLVSCRHQSNRSKAPTPWRTDTTDQPSVFVEENYAKHTVFTLDFFKRFIKYTAVGLLAVSATTWTAFMATHMWVEHVELAPETDEEARKWQWDVEAERWSGGAAGGTDPGLGFMGRLAARSAWMAQNWGTGSSASVIGTKATTRRTDTGDSSLSTVEARLEYAQDFLNIAINTAMKRIDSGKLHPQTITELIARHASIMERMGTKDALFEARSEFERVWAGLPGKGIDATRVALKLGDLNSRLGDPDDALAWWARSIHLAQNDSSTTVAAVPPTVPELPPSSPLAQRTLVSNLVSLSAYYATSGQLRQAQSLEESSLNLLRSIKQPDSLESASRPQALHALYILHRSSLLSIHLAEVSYALREKLGTSIQWLTRAAESSERVALTLTGLPPIHPDAPESGIPHPPSSETPLLSDYAKSRSMSRPAKSLLRDARRTAAEAWNLIGILIEGGGGSGSAEKALECYERALGWAGVAADRAGGIGKAGEGTLEIEWKALWANYVRARDGVRKHQDSK